MFTPYAYAIVEYRMDADDASVAKIQNKLNELGSQGFHIVSVDAVANEKHRRMIWTLERAGDSMQGGRI